MSIRTVPIDIGSRQTTTYSNDTNRSLVTGVTDANGNTTTTAYDSLNRPTTVTSGSASVSYTYSADRLTGIQHGSTNYAITYAPGGQQASVAVGSRTLVSNTYDPATQLLTKQTYGNHQSWNYIYDNTDTLICKYSSEGTAYYYFYDNEGKLARVETWAVSVSGASVTKTALLNTAYYSYDSSERLVAIREENHAVSRSFDSRENVTGFTESFGAVDFAYSYSYDNDNRPTGTSFGNTGTSTAYDSFSRMSGTAVTYNNSSLISASYTYRQTDSTGTIEYNDSEDTSPETGTTVYETTQVRDYAVTAGNTTTTYRFEYDPNGNITSISDGTHTTSFEYDSLGQLTKESNQSAGKVWQYSYDNCGNILSKTEYDYTETNGTWTQAATGTTVTYSYHDSTWGDLLTAYDGQSITYDEIGNPLSYRGMSFTWQGGRQLAGVTKDGIATSYTYNEDGLRTAKTTGSETINYYYSGDVLTGLETSSYSLYFHYDENGGIIGYTKHAAATDTEYFYVKNLQGDILRVIDATGTTAAQYSYDAWGNILTATGPEADTNPIHYRGYYYDTETGLYYLQSRYYDAEVGRFINADEIEYLGADGSIGGFNLFVYCGDNPVMGYDPQGTWNWNGVLTGACIVSAAVLSIATFGVGFGVGTVVASAALATGTILMGAAATDSTFVADFSFGASDGTNTATIGVSLVIDFESGCSEAYIHTGRGKGNAAGLTYSTGIIENYSGYGSYGGGFVQAGASLGWLGINHCFDPNADSHKNAVQATTLTFGAPSQLFEGTAGYDWYSESFIIH